MSDQRIDRGRLLLAGGVALGGFAGFDAIAGASRRSGNEGAFSPADRALSGRITESSANRLVVETADGAFVSVTFGSSAVVWRERPARLAEFEIGEEVVVEGEFIGDEYHGTALINAYRTVNGTVTGRRGDRVLTTDKTVRVVAATRRQVGPEMHRVEARDFSVGDSLVGYGRIEPKSGELILLRAILSR